MKLGSYYVPDISLTQAIEIIKTIYNNQITTDQALALKLEHSTTNSGGFIKKLVTLRQLGLIKSGIKGIELTALGTRIARPLGDEARKSMNELLAHIPLLTDIRKKLGSKNPDKESMMLVLTDLTKVDRVVLDQETSRIQKLYEDAQKYMSQSSDSLSIDEGEIKMETATNMESARIMEIKIGALYMRIPRDIDAIEEAELMLNAQKQKLEREAKKK